VLVSVRRNTWLVDRNRLFRKRIIRVCVNEAHFIYTAGCELYGLPAFRPAWGKLGELRVKLGKNVVFQALSGTHPELVVGFAQNESEN
jgi:hypothetical protein